MGNISGVATSIAVGGPGSIFWMWVWAFFGMMIKTAETSLGLYYRHKEPDGKYSGSAMHYMEWGIKGRDGLEVRPASGNSLCRLPFHDGSSGQRCLHCG